MRIIEIILPLTLAAGIGLAMAMQTAINSQLRNFLNSPIQAAFISFLVGTLCLSILALVETATKPSITQLSQVPIWLWFGGLLGVYAISMSIYTAPKLGFLTFTAIVLLGQTIMSMLLDQFGLIGVEQRSINWQRAFGAVLIAIGIIFTLQR